MNAFISERNSSNDFDDSLLDQEGFVEHEDPDRPTLFVLIDDEEIYLLVLEKKRCHLIIEDFLLFYQT